MTRCLQYFLIVNVTWLSAQRPANLIETFLKNASFCKVSRVWIGSKI